MNIVLRRFLHNHGISRQKEAPKPGLCPTLISNSVPYSAQYHRQHCTLPAFEQFGALYMHNHDDKYSSRPVFEPGNPRLQAPVDRAYEWAIVAGMLKKEMYEEYINKLFVFF